MHIKENRKFGLLVGSAFVLMGCYSFYRRGHINLFLIGLGITLALIGLLFPSKLTRVKAGWEYIGHILGYINTYILLTALYVIVLTPLSLLNRIFGRNPLRLKWNRSAKTYWEDADENKRQQFNQQF